jgi:hypothetical protein
LLIEHKVFSGPKGVSRNIDPRIILLGTNQDDDETFCLRLALANDNVALLMLLWTHFDYLYDERHMMTFARFLLFLGPLKTGVLYEPFL